MSGVLKRIHHRCPEPMQEFVKRAYGKMHTCMNRKRSQEMEILKLLEEHPEYKRIASRIAILHQTKGAGQSFLRKGILRNYYKWNLDQQRWIEGMYWERWLEYPWAIVQTNLKPTMKVLDVGCGTSPFLLYLEELGCKCYGADPASGLISEYEGFPPDVPSLKAFRKITYKRSSILNLEFPDNFFDRVYCISVLEHLDLNKKSLMEAYLEMRRVLRIQGLLCITTPKSLKEIETSELIKKKLIAITYSRHKVILNLMLWKKMKKIGQERKSISTLKNHLYI